MREIYEYCAKITLPLLFFAAVSAFADEPTPTGGTMTFSGRSFLVKDIYGKEQTYSAGQTLTPTSEPALFYIKPVLNEGEHLFSIDTTIPSKTETLVGVAHKRYPLMNGWVPYSPFASTASNMTVSATLAAKVLYVNEKTGSDGYDGLAPEFDGEHGPFSTLKAAAEAAEVAMVNNTLVLVAPGVYSNGVMTVSATDSGVEYTSKRRLVITKKLNVGFRATGGSDKTFIVGAPDPSTGGRGDEAIAGVYMSSSYYQFLQGFTITGCYTPATSSVNVLRGAAFCSGAARASWLDCVVSNNFSTRAIVNYGIVQRCRFFDNESYSAFSSGGQTYIFSSIIAGNRITRGNGTGDNYTFSASCKFYNCTLDFRNALNPEGRYRMADGGNYYNCIAIGYLGTESLSSTSLLKGNMVFVDSGNRDYRLGTLSPALDKIDYSAVMDEIRRGGSVDINGNPILVRDGKTTIGAEHGNPFPCVVLDGDGVSSSSGSLTNVVTESSFTVTATDVHPFLGFDVNGETLSPNSRSFALPMADYAGVTAVVKALYDTNWYIDCNSGSDAWEGTEAKPKQTIRAATTNSVSGDVVHVAPGTYGDLEGAQTHTSGAPVFSRVVVPAGVTVESTGGPTNTFIVGAPPADGDANEYGLGTGSVRCAFGGAGAVLRGFTLTGGRTANSASNDGYGSAFLCVDSANAATIDDCIVSNNVAYRGTLYGSVVNRCRIFENIATKTGPASSSSWNYNTIADKNRGTGTFHSARAIENCTIGAANLTIGGESNPQITYWSDSGNVSMVNTIVCKGRHYVSGTTLYCTNCLVVDDKYFTAEMRENAVNTIATNSAAMKLDSEYRPVFGSNVGIDRGDSSYPSSFKGLDALGNPRVMNGAVDIGAVEYDWRPKFAEALGRKVASVSYVAPSVTTNATAGLALASGAVAGTLAGAGAYRLDVSMPAGTLLLYVDGALAGTVSGAAEESLRFETVRAGAEFCVTFEPDPMSPGEAAVLRIAGANGMMIILN